LVSQSGLAHVVVGIEDPDPRTAGKGMDRIRQAGIDVTLADNPKCRQSLSGFILQKTEGRPHVTLKLAVTADGFIARPDGTSKWITGEPARAHVHMERSRCDAILVGGGTQRADAPRLNVRLPGLEERSPKRFVLTVDSVPDGWEKLASPQAIHDLADTQYLFVEGGAATADAFLSAGLVDRILLYRAPVTFGEGVLAFQQPGPDIVPQGWNCTETRQLGSDTLQVYERG
jgi:diaminohydroxyphosphoribosylaminopyrimidine deaminase/5-amino-6-(5-phosphoribosylamino)uracil reductase